MAKSRIGPFSLEAPMSKPKSSGQVFRGIHLEQRKLAAIRVFPIPMGLTPESRQAYALQLEQLKQLRHPGVVRCYGGGFDHRTAFLAYELIDGESLSSLLERRERLPWETALEFSQQLASGMHYAHELGWTHGRLRPGKILVSKTGVVKIADWRRDAISSMISSNLSPEQTQFTAPECFSNTPPNEKSDLYSLGVVMFTMLTGTPPYVGEPSQVIAQAQTAPIPSVGALVMDCPVWLSAIVEKLLAKAPAQRPYSLAALQLAFKEAQRRQAEGVGVLQHATAGFSALQMNVDRREAEKVLGIKHKKSRKLRETSIFESVWVLLGAFLAALALAVWFMLPLSEENLRTRAEGLLASEKWMDWNEARNGYLQSVVERFPDGQNAVWASQQIDWVNGREAERRLDRDERLGRKDNWTQAQIQYAEARRFERFGDLTTANDKFLAIENLFADRDEDRALVFLAREGIARTKENSQGENLLKLFVGNKLVAAQEDYDEARVSDAKSTLESIIELYADNQEVAELVDQAQDQLDELSRDKRSSAKPRDASEAD